MATGPDDMIAHREGTCCTLSASAHDCTSDGLLAGLKTLNDSITSRTIKEVSDTMMLMVVCGPQRTYALMQLFTPAASLQGSDEDRSRLRAR